MAYRPVPLTPHVCVHCKTLYYAKDKRRIYCTSSCNTLAWMARKPTKKTPKPLVKVQTSSPTQDIAAMILTQVGIAFANFKLNDEPVQKEIIASLTKLKEESQQLLRGMQHQVHFTNACIQAEPGLKPLMNKLRQEGKLEEANHQQKKGRVDAIVTKKFG